MYDVGFFIGTILAVSVKLAFYIAVLPTAILPVLSWVILFLLFISLL